jgi:hypothetical protein
MRPDRFVLSVCLLTAGSAQAGPARYPQTYNDLFTFGMSRDEVARLVEAPLVYLSGAPGSERYLVQRPASVPGLYPVDTRIVLQFRRNRLTGWRRDWQMRPFWF